MIDIASIRAAINNFAESCQMLEKSAFVPGPQGGPPPGAMPPGGDPNAMPPPPPGGDPNAMPPGAMPPGDPNAMPPGAMPPPPGDPNAMPPGGAPPAGGMPPELEQTLSDMSGGMQEIAQTVEQQQATVEQLGSRQLEIENKLQELQSLLKGPAPFEGSSKGPADVETSPEAGPPPSDSEL